MSIDWWAKFLQLSLRERWMLGSGVVFCFFVLFYLAFYAPLARSVHEKTVQLIEKKSTLTWMEHIHYLSKQQHAPMTIHTNAFLTVLANQLNSTKFQHFPYQLQQTGTRDIQLSFDNIPYPTCMLWLWSLTKSYKVSLTQFEMERQTTPGVVRVRMVFSLG